MTNKPPDYKAYLKTAKWKAKRKAKLEECHGRCQRCGSWYGRREVHHKTYERFGNEKPEDLMVLCPDCHSFEDKLRAQQSAEARERLIESTIHDNGRDTYMTKKYGHDWRRYHWDDRAEFDDWLERKHDGGGFSRDYND